MDLYSVALSVSLVAAVASLGLALVGRFAPKLRSFALGAAFAALAFVSVSMSIHLVAGHRPGSPTALGPGAYFREHPAFVITAAVAMAALVLLRRRNA